MEYARLSVATSSTCVNSYNNTNIDTTLVNMNIDYNKSPKNINSSNLKNDLTIKSNTIVKKNTVSNDIDKKYRIYIKYLPKDKLLYQLWKYAKPAYYMYYCKDTIPVLTLEKAKQDINYMIHNNRTINISTYYGKQIFIDITGDYLNTLEYNLYNGRNLAEYIIDNLKKEEMQRSVLKYYTFF